jgi:hypothetical protein
MSTRPFAMFREVFASRWGGRSIDLWAIATWESARAFGHGSGHEPLMLGFEVKISRQDWKRELEYPDKREPAMSKCHVFYFAVPDGMVGPDEVPEGMRTTLCIRTRPRVEDCCSQETEHRPAALVIRCAADAPT